MTVIELRNQEDWREANLTKESIVWMKQRQDPRFQSAIEKEEALLEEFFEQFRSKN